ncbi:MAG: DUF393 domain-containing protein [Burkholderiales bacterium]
MQAINDTNTKVFYDGACPLCNAEMKILRRWDRAGRLDLIDIAVAEYDEHAWPMSVDDLNALLHVRLPDGAWLTGMAATRHIYRVVGRGWMLAFTGWPLLSRVFDFAYAWFARNRMPVSARLGVFVGARRCADNVCNAPR